MGLIKWLKLLIRSCIRCRQCKYFKIENEDSGECLNDEVVNKRIVHDGYERIYIADDFGCRFFEEGMEDK